VGLHGPTLAQNSERRRSCLIANLPGSQCVADLPIHLNSNEMYSRLYPLGANFTHPTPRVSETR
jgi:hypothetical protein